MILDKLERALRIIVVWWRRRSARKRIRDADRRARLAEGRSIARFLSRPCDDFGRPGFR